MLETNSSPRCWMDEKLLNPLGNNVVAVSLHRMSSISLPWTLSSWGLHVKWQGGSNRCQKLTMPKE